jgi:hypothetical protein
MRTRRECACVRVAPTREREWFSVFGMKLIKKVISRNTRVAVNCRNVSEVRKLTLFPMFPIVHLVFLVKVTAGIFFVLCLKKRSYLGIHKGGNVGLIIEKNTQGRNCNALTPKTSSSIAICFSRQSFTLYLSAILCLPPLSATTPCLVFFAFLCKNICLLHYPTFSLRTLSSQDFPNLPNLPQWHFARRE